MFEMPDPRRLQVAMQILMDPVAQLVWRLGEAARRNAALEFEPVEEVPTADISVSADASVHVEEPWRCLAAREGPGDLEHAEWIVRAVAQRGVTLRRVVSALLVADGVVGRSVDAIAAVGGFHPSTVRRAARGKVLRTPRGEFELSSLVGRAPD